MRSFTIGFSKSTIPFPIGSYAIRLYQGTEYSHVFVILDTARHLGSDTVYQSSRGMVNCMSLDVFLEENEIVEIHRIEVPDDVYVAIRNGLHSETGRHYGTLQNLGIPISDLLNIKNPWKKGYNCSELIYEKVLLPLNPDLSLHYDKDTVTPKDVNEIIKNVDYTVKEIE